MRTAIFQSAATATCEEIREVIASGRTPVLQFSEAPDGAELERTDQFAREFGAELQIRFFGFHWREFDTALLRQLPNVANLSIDTIRTISDFGSIAELSKLTRLRFQVHEHPDGSFLNQLQLERFTDLSLGETKRHNFDLSPLVRATGLERLFIRGHDRGIESISGLSRLHDIWLSGFPKRHDLAFLNDLPSLRSLLLILGSRKSIAEFTHAGLRKLSILRVSLLEELGPLDRFRELEELTIEDELRLTSLDVSGLDLRRLTVANCKALERIDGLTRQTRLAQLSIHRTLFDDQNQST